MPRPASDGTVQVSRNELEGEVVLNRENEEEEEEELQCIERDKEDEEEDDETFEGCIRRKVGTKRGSYIFVLRDDQGTQLVTEQKPFFPELVPFPSGYEIEKLLLLEALREETAIKDPDTIYKKCFEEVKILRECGTLDKYILSDEEAAVLCATTKLFENEFNFRKLFQPCKEKASSKFAVLLLKSLRKLPQHKGTLYFGRGSSGTLQERVKGQFLRHPFCFASSSMAVIREGLEKFKFKQVFRVEDCWGYDISDFVCTKDKEPSNCKIFLTIYTLCNPLFILYN